MDATWSVPAWAALATLGVIVVLAAAAVAVLVRASGALRRAEQRRAVAEADLRAEVRALAERLRVVERPVVPASDAVSITSLGEDRDLESNDTAAVPAPLFADLVLREGVVQAAGLAAGLRRALAPETRGRIRAEMRREVKRARRQRRADVRAARRQVASPRAGA